MKELFWRSVVIAALFSSYGRSAQVTLPVEPRHQEASDWCWAACGEMIMDHLGTDVSQCQLANDEFWASRGEIDCCEHKTSSPCNKTAFPHFEDYGFTCKKTQNAPLSWRQVKSQIQTKRKPFAFSWHWNGGSGHMMVMVGCGTADGEKWIEYWDPLAQIGTDYKLTTYDAYVKGNGYTHWDDLYDVTKSN
jgi:hypothetical protein